MGKCRPPDKSAYWKTVFFISHPKHMLWVLKRTVLMRWFFWVPKTHAGPLVEPLKPLETFILVGIL